MLQDWVVRLMGIGMAGLMKFAPMEPLYRAETLTVPCQLEHLVTGEVRDAVSNGYEFRIAFSFSLIVNNRKSFETSVINRFSKDSVWRLNGVPISPDSIGRKMGSAAVNFSHLRFDEGDEVMVFVKAKILDDSLFTRSTGLPTSILWNYYVPRSTTYWEYHNGKFLLQ